MLKRIEKDCSPIQQEYISVFLFPWMVIDDSWEEMKQPCGCSFFPLEENPKKIKVTRLCDDCYWNETRCVLEDVSGSKIIYIHHTVTKKNPWTEEKKEPTLLEGEDNARRTP